MEKEVKIRTPDRKLIHGTLITPPRRTKEVVILVHGLCGHNFWPPLLAASKHFQNQGFAVLRFDLYSSWLKDARRFLNSSLTHHSKDLDTCAKYLQKNGFNRLYAVGHSFGGLTILRSNTEQFNAVSMWDISSPRTYPLRRSLKFDRRIGKYVLAGQVDMLVSKKYVADIDRFPDELALISKMKCPTQICYADGPRGMLIQPSKDYFAAAPKPKQLVPIANSSHCFLEGVTDRELFRKASNWFRRYR